MLAKSVEADQRRPGGIAMKRLLLIVLGIPLFALLVGVTLPAKVRDDFAVRLARANPDRSPEDLAQYPLDHYCGGDDASTTSACEDLRLLRILTCAAVAVAAAGLGLLGLIRLAGGLAAADRTRLLWTFGPGLHLTNIALIVLVLANTGLAVVSAHLAQVAFLGRSFSLITSGMGLSALAGVFTLARASFAVTRVGDIPTIAYPIRASEAPELWSFVRGLAERMDVELPDHVLLGLEPNFFVTEAPVRAGDDRVTGRTLVVSLPLMHVLSRDELAFVIGHELGHYKGRDVEYSRRFYPIYGRSTRALSGLEAQFNRDVRGVALLPAIAILSYFVKTFAIAEYALGRERELAADSAGAALVGASVGATALVKVHAFAGAWAFVERDAVDRLRRSEAFDNLSRVFAETVKHNAAPSILEGIDAVQTAHPIDTHPPLRERMKNLGIALAEVSESALALDDDHAAIHLVSEPQRIERKLTEARYAIYRQVLEAMTTSAAQSAPKR